MPRSLLLELPDEHLASATAALDGCSTVALVAGAVRDANDLGDSELLIVEQGFGLVERRLPLPEVRGHVAVAVVSPGSIFLRPTCAERLRALTDLELTALTDGNLRDLLETPDVAAVLFDRLGDQLRQCHESLALVGFNHHVDRIRAKLMQLAERYGKVVGGGVRLDLPLTHDLLAHMLGSTRATVTRMLAQLESEGFLRRDRRFLMLTVPPDRLA